MDITTILLSALVVLIVLLIILSIALLRLLWSQNISSNENKALETRLQEMNNTLNSRLNENTESMYKQMQNQYESSKSLITDITKELTEVKTTGREMISFTKQLQALEQTLKNPQRRGAVGEYVLEQVIANVLPPDTYAIQYSFQNGVRADAVVFLQDKKKISIDAKFSLDNYTKLLSGELEYPEAVERQLKEDLKTRIQETTKYIIPEEGTLDYAFMFIPSESLYYDLLTQKIGSGDTARNMLEYAFQQHRVIIVSPTTLLAYLQTVYFGLRSLKVEEHAHEITKHVEMLQKHLENYSKAFRGIGNALGTAVNQYNNADQQYKLIDKDAFKITGKGGKYIKESLDRPNFLDTDE